MYRGMFAALFHIARGVCMTEPASTTTETPARRSLAQTALSILRLVVINFLVFAVLAEIASIILVDRKSVV